MGPGWQLPRGDRVMFRDRMEAGRSLGERLREEGLDDPVVLGLPRLHHILARDALTSKSGAAAYALEEFGEAWRPLLAEALAYRVSGERAGLLDEHELAAQTIRFAELVLARGLAIPV